MPQSIRRSRAFWLVFASLIALGCDALSPTTVTKETVIYGLRAVQRDADPYVGDEIRIEGIPFTYTNPLGNTSADDQKPVAGVHIRWSVSPAGILKMNTADVTTSGYIGLLSEADPVSLARFTALAHGTATVTATVEGVTSVKSI